MTTHQNGCKFTGPKRFINCLVCTDDLTHLETSTIYCDWQRNVPERADPLENYCKKYSHGQSTSLAQVTDMDPPECLGCL
uniref:Uncharacterized protein n=1 Tax=Anguilla anguilla TaxID=7936 RepID=A0A0E9Y2I9_ANGAN